MTILALEFSSPQRSVALARDDSLLSEAIRAGDRGTAALAMINEVLTEAKLQPCDIQTIVVGLGPGSYTGVRAAIAMAQGWQLALGTRTLGLDSIAAIAAQAQAENIFGRVNVVVDAQRNEFYCAAYEITESRLSPIRPLMILPAAEAQSRARRGEILIGPEAARHFPGSRTVFPRAAALAKLAAGRNDFLPCEKLEPVYLRETTFLKAQPNVLRKPE